MARWTNAPASLLRVRALREERSGGSAAEPCIIDCAAAAEVGGARRHLAKSPAAPGMSLQGLSHPHPQQNLLMCEERALSCTHRFFHS